MVEKKNETFLQLSFRESFISSAYFVKSMVVMSYSCMTAILRKFPTNLIIITEFTGLKDEYLRNNTRNGKLPCQVNAILHILLSISIYTPFRLGLG